MLRTRPLIPTACVTTIPRKVWETVISRKKTFDWLMQRYRQPDHCTYPDALMGLMGCWSLMKAPWSRTKKRCFDCEYFRGRELINYERNRAAIAKMEARR